MVKTIDKMNDEERRVLAGKLILRQSNYASYWKPLISKGKKYFDIAVGNILSEEEKARMRLAEKLILQIPELMPKIQAMVGMMLNLTKEGAVVARRSGEDAADATVVDEISKEIDRTVGLKESLTSVFNDAIISGYPQFMWFDASFGPTFEKTLDIYHDHWDATFPDPNWSRNDLSDMRDVIRVRLMSIDDIKRKFPKQAREVEASVGHKESFNDLYEGTPYTAEDRDTLFISAAEARETLERFGSLFVYERYYFEDVKETVYISYSSEDPVILPDSWDDQKRLQWLMMNPEYRALELTVPVLFVTTCTQSGILLEHNRHWYQKGKFPCEAYVPMWQNNKPYGMVGFMADNAKLGVVAEIEHIHSIRLANNNLMITKEGAIKNADDASSERAQPGGHLIVDASYNIGDAVQFPRNNREQTAFADVKAMTLATNDRLSVERNFEGAMQGSQESGTAIQARIQQSIGKQGMYVSSFNSFFMRVQRKKIEMIPIVYTEPFVLRYMNGKTKEFNEVEVNQPVAFDWSGNVVAVMNNLTGAEYDYIETFGDNSITGRQYEMNSFVEIARNILPTIPQDQWAVFLLTMPNRYANEYGQQLLEMQKAAADQRSGEPMRLSLNIKGDDLLYNEPVAMILKREGVLPQEYQTQQPQQQSEPSEEELALMLQQQQQGVL